MPPRTVTTTEEKRDETTTEKQESKTGYVVVTPTGFVPGVFDNEEDANTHGLVTYGLHHWWALVPIIKAKFPKEEDE